MRGKKIWKNNNDKLRKGEEETFFTNSYGFAIRSIRNTIPFFSKRMKTERYATQNQFNYTLNTLRAYTLTDILIYRIWLFPLFFERAFVPICIIRKLNYSVLSLDSHLISLESPQIPVLKPKQPIPYYTRISLRFVGLVEFIS